MSEMQEAPTQETGTGGEFVKFGVMAGLLIGTVLVIWLLRPFIFNVVVPAVMGEGQPTAPLPLEAENQLPLKEPPAVDAGEAPPAAEGGTDIFIPAVPVEGDDAAVPTEETAGESAPVEATTPAEVDVNAAEVGGGTAVTHTVQPGENLTTIAQQYGVTVDAIIAANNITTPNRIVAGTVLQIPSK